MKTIQLKYAQISTNELARLLGITGRRVNQLVDAGVIPKAGRNLFNDEEAIQAFIEHRISEVREEFVTARGGAVNYEDERARLTKIRADIAQEQLNLTQGNSHDAEEITFYMGQAVAACRAQILAMPNALAATLADLNTPEACRDVLDEACRETAQALSDYDPEEVSGKTKEKIIEAAKSETEEDEGAA